MTLPSLRILVVDEDAQRGKTLVEVLRVSGYEVVHRVSAADYLPQVVMDHGADLVLIDCTSPSRDTLEQLTALHRDHPRPVVVFAQDDDEKTIERAVRAGVSAYLVDGLAMSSVKPIIDVAVAHFRQHEAMRMELEKARSSLEDRKYIDRAKALLIEQRTLSEPEAYALMRKLAMDRKQRLGQVAREMLGAWGILPQPHRKQA